MLLSDRTPTGRPSCVYGCCTDWPPGGRYNRQRRRIARARENQEWRRDRRLDLPALRNEPTTA